MLRVDKTSGGDSNLILHMPHGCIVTIPFSVISSFQTENETKDSFTFVTVTKEGKFSAPVTNTDPVKWKTETLPLLEQQLKFASIRRYNIIVAYTKKGRGIGCNGKLPWAPIKEDMDHFRFRTIGQTVIMGRKTWSSLPSTSRPLSGRTNIVVSSTLTAEEAKGAIVCKSFEEALKAVPDDTEAWVIGGAQLYEEAVKLGCWKMLWATEVDQDVKCDTFFPEIKSTDRAEAVRAYSTLRKDVTFVAYQSPRMMPDVTGFKLLIAASACVPGNRLQLGSERGIYDPVVYAKSLGAPVTVTAKHVLAHRALMKECKDTPVDKTTIIRIDDIRADHESSRVDFTRVEDKVLQLWRTGGREAACDQYGEVDVELRTKFKDP